MIVEGLDLAAVQVFFDAEVPEARGPLRAQLLPGGRSNLTYRLTDGHSSWVLRRPPLGGLTPSAHDMAREYRVVAALANTSVPVPRPVALGQDLSILGMPFSVVEYVAGQVIRTQDDLHALPDADIVRCAYGLIDVLAELHAVDPEAVGLGGFGRPKGYLARQIRRWHDQWNRVRSRALPDVETLHLRLAETCPAESASSIVHGDYRIDNAILDAGDVGTVRALVDWEMATVGDPLADLGLHLAYSDPALDFVLGKCAASTSSRLPSTDDLAQRYAIASRRNLDNLAFYRALGYFKGAVIAEGVYARYTGGFTLGPGFETAGQAVPLLAAAGINALAAHR
ncbi:MAG: phosphotransferase family protein [Pseudonocardiales bacterium]|nr:phosphotransferase family protein [Pseudonocardiales bacterium]